MIGNSAWIIFTYLNNTPHRNSYDRPHMADGSQGNEFSCCQNQSTWRVCWCKKKRLVNLAADVHLLICNTFVYLSPSLGLILKTITSTINLLQSLSGFIGRASCEDTRGAIRSKEFYSNHAWIKQFSYGELCALPGRTSCFQRIHRYVWLDLLRWSYETLLEVLI